VFRRLKDLGKHGRFAFSFGKPSAEMQEPWPYRELLSGQTKYCLARSLSNQPYEGLFLFLNSEEEKDANILLGQV